MQILNMKQVSISQFEELGHMIMEAEKPHDILSESWRTRGADGINPSPLAKEYTCPCSISQVGSFTASVFVFYSG